MKKVNWCKKNLLHVQLYFYYRGRRRCNMPRKDIIVDFKNDFNISDNELSEFSAQRCITLLNKDTYKKGVEKSQWCDSTMAHLQLFFFYKGIKKLVKDKAQVVELFMDDFNYTFTNGVSIITELDKTIC